MSSSITSSSSSTLLNDTTTLYDNNNNTTISMFNTDNDNNDNNNDDDLIGLSNYFVLFALLLTIVLVLSKYLHDSPKLSTIFPEAGMVLLVGMIAGSFINIYVYYLKISSNNNNNSNSNIDIENLLHFSPQIFFIYLLPPIIFNSGYHIRRELFFRHIVPICLFAIIGTTVSALVIAFVLQLVQNFNWISEAGTNFTPTFAELLTFGGLISATDPVSTLAVFQTKCVDPQLFYLVFGESVLNDAVGLVLFTSFSKFITIPVPIQSALPINMTTTGSDDVSVAYSTVDFIITFIVDSIGSPVLGIVCGCLTGLFFKYTSMKDSKLLELSVYILIMYVPFLIAQTINLSGIVTILFTGMTARAYVVPNLSIETKETSETLFRLFAHVAETSLFLELGLSVFGTTFANSTSFHGIFILWSLLACFIGRVCNVYPLTILYNLRLRFLPPDSDEIKQHSEYELQEQQNRYKVTRSSTEETVESINDDENNTNEHDMMVDTSDNSTECEIGSSNRSNTNGTIQMSNRSIRRRKTPTTLSSLTTKQSKTSTTSTSFCNSNTIFQSNTDNIALKVRHDLIIEPKTAHMMCFSGLRGAVAYACVRSFPDTYGNRTAFTVITMAIVLITTFGCGTLTEFMLNYLQIDINVDEDIYMENWYKDHTSPNCIVVLEDCIQRIVVQQNDSIGTTNTKHVHEQVSTIDHDDNDDDIDNDNDDDYENNLNSTQKDINDNNISAVVDTSGVTTTTTKSSLNDSRTPGIIILSSSTNQKRGETSLFDFGGLS